METYDCIWLHVCCVSFMFEIYSWKLKAFDQQEIGVKGSEEMGFKSKVKVQAMMAYGGEEAQPHSIKNSAIGRGELSASRSGRFIPNESGSCNHTRAPAPIWTFWKRGVNCFPVEKRSKLLYLGRVHPLVLNYTIIINTICV
jgi:hypothetical protein